MPKLTWRGKATQRQLIARTPLKNGSEVLMEGSEYWGGNLPKYFYLGRTYTPPIKKFLKARGKDPYKFIGDEFTAQPYSAVPDTARSEPFALEASGFYLHTHRWLFEDSFGNRCPYELRTARFGGFDVTGGAKVPVHGVEAGLTVHTTASTCLDPELEFSILVPRVEPDPETKFSIQNLADDEVRLVTEDFGEDVGQAFGRFVLDHLEPYGGWEFVVSPGLVELGEGESAPVDVHVTIGKGQGAAFAVQAKDLGNPEQSFVSDIVIIHRSDSGQVALYADDEIKLEA